METKSQPSHTWVTEVEKSQSFLTQCGKERRHYVCEGGSEQAAQRKYSPWVAARRPAFWPFQPSRRAQAAKIGVLWWRDSSRTA